MAAGFSSEFEQVFCGAVQYASDTGFSEIRELKPVQEDLLHFIKREDVFAVLSTGCGKSLTFQLVPKVCSYLHGQGFSYPEAAMEVVICLLIALIDSHIQELQYHCIFAWSLADEDILESVKSGHQWFYFFFVCKSKKKTHKITPWHARGKDEGKVYAQAPPGTWVPASSTWWPDR